MQSFFVVGRGVALGASVAVLLAASPVAVRAHGNAGLAIASTAPGGGTLAIDYDFGRVVPVSFVTEVAGTSLYTADEPAFSSLAADEPGRGLYRVAGGTSVSIEITALDAGRTAMKVRGTVLDAVGAAVVLGVQDAPPPGDLDDQHPELQLLLELPPGEFGAGTIAFKLTTTAGAYAESASYTLRLSNGHVAPLGFAASTYDKRTVACQQAIGKAAGAFAITKQKALAKCLDKLVAIAASEHAHLDTARPAAAAANACGDKLLATLAQARDKAVDAMLKKCVPSGDLTHEGATAHVGLAGCRVEELMSASYPGAQGMLSRVSAGGGPVDVRFPCLEPAPRE